MKRINTVRCLDNPPQELEINVDTVYKRYNIISSINEEGKTEYTYDEDQYTISEYLKEIVPQNEEGLGELTMLLAQYQLQTDLAIAELSMTIGGNSNV